MDVFSTIQEISNYKKPDAIPFLSRDDVKQAMEDFRYLGTQSYYVILFNMGLLGVSKNGEHLIDVLCVPVDLDKKTSSFPKDKVRLDAPNMFVAAVCYKNGKAVDVLLFNSSLFNINPETSKFKKFFNKILNRKDLIELSQENSSEFVLNISDSNSLSLRKYAFANVMANFKVTK